MAAQLIEGLGSEAVPSCYVIANQLPACNAVKTLPIKEPAKAQKDRQGEGRGFSGSLA